MDIIKIIGIGFISLIITIILKEYRKEYFAEGQLFYFLKAHNYSTYHGCGIETMTEAHYQMTLPDDEYIFGNNSK